MEGNIYEATTLLTVRDEATAALQRFIAVLRDVQAQVDGLVGQLRVLQRAMGPSTASIARQREAVGLLERQVQLGAELGAQTVAQADAMVGARRESLALARAELGTQRGIRASLIPAANRAGSTLLWTGGGIVGGLAYATQKAMDFNQTALETDIALGGYARTPAQRSADILALQRGAMAGSEATGFFDAQSILEGLKVAASSGARPLVEQMGMGNFTAIVPALSRYMDVVGRLKGSGADQAAMEAIRVSHMFGAYTPDAINRILNAQAALALLMPDKMSTATTTAAYVAPSGVNLAGVPQEAILALIATADQSGLGRGRAGARLKDYVEAIAVTQSKGRESAKHLLGLGGALDEHGSLDLMKSFEILQADAKRMRPQAFRDAVRQAFGAQGSVVAAMFGDPSKQRMFEANRQVIEQAVGRGDLQGIQDILKGGTRGQEALMVARLKNDIIEFGQYGLPIAVKFFDTINPKLKEFSDWTQQHPDDAKNFFDNLLHIGEAMLVLGAALKVVAGVASAVKVVQTLAGGISKLTGAAGGARGAVEGLAGGLARLLARVSPWLALLSLGGDSGNAPVMPDPNAPPGSPAWLAAAKQHADARNSFLVRGQSSSTKKRLDEALNTTHVHIGTVNLPGVTNARQFLDELNDPRSVLYQGTQTHPRMPRTLSVPPR